MACWQKYDLGGCGCACSQTFAVDGCAPGVPGVTVNVLTGPGGATLSSGVTDATGRVTLSWAGPGSVYVTISGGPSGRFAPYGRSLTLTCGGSTTIALTPASGYICVPWDTAGACPIPMKSTIQMTFSGGSAYSTGPLTWDGTYFTGNTPCTVAACMGCTGSAVTLFNRLNGGDGSISTAWNTGDATDPTSGCPNDAGPYEDSFPSVGGGTTVCPPSFGLTIAYPGPYDVPEQKLICTTTGACTWSFTE